MLKVSLYGLRNDWPNPATVAAGSTAIDPNAGLVGETARMT